MVENLWVAGLVGGGDLLVLVGRDSIPRSEVLLVFESTIVLTSADVG